jgi:SulP family sulfate permease
VAEERGSQEDVAKERRSASGLGLVAAGLIIGAVEVVLAVAFAAFVFGGTLVRNLGDGIGLYLVAAALTLGFLAWRAGSRGVVGSVQDAATAVLAGVASTMAFRVLELARQAQASGVTGYERPDIFLTVIATTLVVTMLCGVVFYTLGRFRLGNMVRFVPYPVVGGFLAGTGWLLFKGGIFVASGVEVRFRFPMRISEATALADLLVSPVILKHWAPAFAFGAILLIAVRRVKKPLVIPIVIALGLVAFAIGMLVTGSSLDAAKHGRWLLGPFESARLWQPWTLRALSGADWSAVLKEWFGIATAVFVATIAILFNISGTEVVLRRDLETNRELRDTGVLNVISGALGGIPGYHALSLTALAERMSANARTAGLIAAAVPLAGVIFGASVIELIPRMIVGGVLVFLGLAFMVEWVWDKRKVLPPFEYVVVLAILAVIIAQGYLPGVEVGLVLAVVLFAVSYGRIEIVREVPFGDIYTSNVDRPAEQHALLRTMADQVQILRVNGFIFFGTTNGLLERIRKRVAASPPRFLVIDLRRVTGVDSSGVAAFVKVLHMAEANGFEVVFAGASDQVRAQLAQGGVVEGDRLRFEPDLDRALQRCEEGLLAEQAAAAATPDGDGVVAGMPAALGPHLERVELAEGTTLIHQDEAPGDVFVLESGRLRVETLTAEGVRMRLRTLRPGVVVGEIAHYTGVPRTADVVAETPVAVLRLSSDAIERIEAAEPELAAQLHRWLAWTLADRLGDTMRTFDAMLD